MKKAVQISMLLLFAAIVTTSCGKGGSKSETNVSVNEEVVEKPAKASSKKAEAAAEKKIPFERGSYVQETNAMGMDLKQTVYFDRWGDWTTTEDKSEISMMGMTIKTHKLEIVKGKTHWRKRKRPDKS